MSVPFRDYLQTARTAAPFPLTGDHEKDVVRLCQLGHDHDVPAAVFGQLVALLPKAPVALPAAPVEADAEEPVTRTDLPGRAVPSEPPPSRTTTKKH